MQIAPTANIVRRRFLLDEWNDAADEFHALERSALGYLDNLDICRRSTYGAAAVKRIDDHAADFAGRALDLLSDMIGAFHKRLDEEGIDLDGLTYDDGLLREQFDMWTIRAEARR